MFIADSSARSKVCNSTQFNGKYGCLKCLHPTIHNNSHTIYPTLKKLQSIQRTKDHPNKYDDLNSFELRSAQRYKTQVTKAGANAYEGIKGHTHLSKWISIPMGVYLVKMHLSDIGTFRTMFNAFFDIKNKKEIFHIGNKSKGIIIFD